MRQIVETHIAESQHGEHKAEYNDPAEQGVHGLLERDEHYLKGLEPTHET